MAKRKARKPATTGRTRRAAKPRAKAAARRPGSGSKAAAARRKPAGRRTARRRAASRPASSARSTKRPRRRSPKHTAKRNTSRSTAAARRTSTRSRATKPSRGTAPKVAPRERPRSATEPGPAPPRAGAGAEREDHGAPSSLDFERRASAARSGGQELQEHLREHTETGPALTGGDVDANWESAYSSGDEAAGGDNPTPDQDVVEEIGRAIGVEYQDNEPLRSSDKIRARDRHRWEFDPASAEDYETRSRRRE